MAMQLPSQEVIESVISEFKAHENDQHEQGVQCEFCLLAEMLDSFNRNNPGINPFDQEMAHLLNKLEIRDIIVQSGTTSDLLDISRYALMIGIKIGRRQAQGETLDNLISKS